MNFDNFNFDPSIMAGVHSLGYTTPTPIQSRAIPAVLSGKDIIGLAQTGTGKTAAFVLPILQRLFPGRRGVVRALIVSPTRELAEQISEAAGELGRQTGLRTLAVYGGTGMDQQVRALNGRTEIVVACPGRLLDHVWKGSINLDNVEILVIDEADRMLDMGFLPDIRNILRIMMGKKQTLLFSATMPADIRRLAEEILENPVTVQIGRSEPANTVSHALYNVSQEMKTSLLISLLREIETESVLVFTRTKHRTERVAQQLQRAGYKTASLQGNLTQNRRDYAIDGFRSGDIKILVATDIAARGIDVSSISHVINYDMPENVDAYTHRIGRTGRVEKKGDAFTFATSSDRAMVRLLESVLKEKLEKREVKGFADRAPEKPAVKSPASKRPTRWSNQGRNHRAPARQRAQPRSAN
jgi:ATP-dependent RNA helicase RhlE